MKYSTYKIVVCYGFIDIIQLSVYICNGIFAITGTTGNKWIEKICGFQLSFCWYNIASLTVLLAINRLTLLYYGVRAEYFFNPRMTWFILFLTIAIPSISSLIWLTPFATYGFDAKKLMWTYDSPDFMPPYDRLATLITSVLATACYVLLLIVVLKKSSPTGNKMHDNSRRRDILLTIQVVTNGGYTVCVSTYFMFLRPYYVPYTVMYNAVDIALCVLWNGKSPIMHLLFNQHIRVKFLEDIQKRKVFSLVLNVVYPQHKLFSPTFQTSVNGIPLNRTVPVTRNYVKYDHYGAQTKQNVTVAVKSVTNMHR
uniref:7TM GPCR serpentine receptor class x (Srx) domain-containing protein n=1 Tax=Setaria digitata TaxID=48799 RepID=A0A915PIQ6_9BILA